ncbi:hypothetical protein CEE45_02600 [Candidatus Heimdallarchaeota archaeon B3_Heim]|nr:MAG: hypothetical protein CEE45_02600 [Candidatus Heimdallarchaeota archaeon B3_Heim]
MFSGLIVTTMGDKGPYPLLNLSSIPEDTAENLSVIGMTILFMGAGTLAERQHYRLHGSLPVPNNPNIEALALSFTVSPTETSDIRIDQHGRESTIWLLFKSENRERVFQLHPAIERALQEETKNIKDESDLSDPEKMEKVLSRLKQITESPGSYVPVSDESEPSYIHEKGGLEFFTVNTEGDLREINLQTDLATLPVLILVNTLLKRIFLIKLKDSVSQHLMFHAGTSASNINTNRFKNRFSIRDVLDPMERAMILEKIGIIQEIGSQ